MTIYYQQRTVGRPVECHGIGVHSGKNVKLTIKPAPLNHGIKFKRVDLQNQPCIPAHFSRVVDTSLATVIGADGCIVSTIEHLMAAFSGLSIDNALVEVDSYELPIMDGSAGPFTRLISTAGAKEQDGNRYYFRVNTPIELKENGKSVSIFPSDEFKISCTIEYDNPLIGRQMYVYQDDENNFEQEISHARTYGFLHEYEYMRRYGLAQGGSLENAVVIDKDRVINHGGLRYRDEFVRHKILDCIGDFSLLGMPLLGHVVINKSGHAFNHAFLEKFFAEKDSWETLAAHELFYSRNNSGRQVAVSQH